MSFCSVGRKKPVKPLGIRVWDGNEDYVSYLPGGSVSSWALGQAAVPLPPHTSLRTSVHDPFPASAPPRHPMERGQHNHRDAAEAAIERCTGFDNYQKNQHCLFHENVTGQYSGMGPNMNDQDQLPDPEMGDKCYQAIFLQYKCFLKSIKQTSMAEKYMRY